MKLFGKKQKSENDSMKILVASDIHGSASSAKKIVEAFKALSCEKF